jgi:cytochrome c
MEQAAAPAAAGGGDAAAGKKVWQAHLCFACHSFEAGKNGAGPSLAGVFGRKAGEVEGFDFSDALKNANATVDAAFLEQWLQAPQKVVAGTKMVLAKPVTDATDRANLIAYIKEESGAK